MIGAVLGDIAGSKWEFVGIDGYYEEGMKLFQNDSFYTDDTVLAAATKWAIINGCDYGEAYRLFFEHYPDCSYGGMFRVWAQSSEPKPYNSCGNGSAMRVGYIGECFNSEEKVIEEAAKSAECTHNHPEGIKGAVGTAMCILYGRPYVVRLLTSDEWDTVIDTVGAENKLLHYSQTASWVQDAAYDNPLRHEWKVVRGGR